MTFDPVEQLRRYHAAINTLDFDFIEESFSPDAVYSSIGIGDIVGRAAIMAAFRRYFLAYPDQIAEDDVVEALSARSVRSLWRLTATHAESGEISRRSGEEIAYFDGNGKITRIEVQDN